MRNLLLTSRAEKSLEEIVDYYLEFHSSERAIKVVQSIEDAFAGICKAPYNYPVCFDIKNPVDNVRQIIVHHTFKIVFGIRENNIEVIEILHGRRDPKLIEDIS